MNDVKQIKQRMSKIDNIEKMVTKINLQVTDLETKVSTIDTSVIEVEESCSFINTESEKQKLCTEKTKSDLKTLQKTCHKLEENIKQYESQNAQLESKYTDLEARSMRDNLLFYGIPESDQTENCEQLVKQVCTNKLHIPEAAEMKFDRVHRLGQRSNNKTRPIVAKFHHYTDRETIRTKSYDEQTGLKQSNLGIGVQWPKQIRDTRKSLYPIMQREREKGNTVKMVRDKLFINGHAYQPPNGQPINNQRPTNNQHTTNDG
ncbi:MAG: hypothetical protein ABW185_05695 [Sedimenticola sp.]